MLRSLAIIPAGSSAYAMRLLHSFSDCVFHGDMGNAGDAFSSTFVGKYGFGHCDLNLPQSQLFAGRYGKQTIWNIILKTPTSTSLSRPTSGVTTYKPKTRKHISWWELWSAWWRVNTYFHHAHWVSLQSFPCLNLNKSFIKQIVKRMPLVFEDHLKCSSGFTWHLPLRKRSTYFVTRIANLVLLYGLRDFWSGITGIKVHRDSQWDRASRNLWQTSLQFFLIGWWKLTSVWKEYENEINRHSILWLWVKWIE